MQGTVDRGSESLIRKNSSQLRRNDGYDLAPAPAPQIPFHVQRSVSAAAAAGNDVVGRQKEQSHVGLPWGIGRRAKLGGFYIPSKKTSKLKETCGQ